MKWKRYGVEDCCRASCNDTFEATLRSKAGDAVFGPGVRVVSESLSNVAPGVEMIRRLTTR